MKTTILPKTVQSLAFILFVCLLISNFSYTKASADPTAEIKRAVEDLYIKGLKTRDFSFITTICIQEAKLMSADGDGKLHITTLERWSKRFDPSNPPFQSLEYQISKVDFKGSAAQVRIDFIVDSSREVTDYLNLLKLEDQWRIVNIIDY